MKSWGFRMAILLGFGIVLSMSNTQGQNPAIDGSAYLPPLKPVDLNTPPVTVYSQVENHSLVPWNTLAHFEYDAPDIDEEIDPHLRLKKKKRPIPDFVKNLDGATIAVVGFMIPLDTDDADQKATSFILARTQASCCYGIVPKMNEWMFVRMAKGKTADVMMDCPITVFGTLSVGEEKEENAGWSLYRMVSDKVKIPKIDW
jgi:hypothetical protein